MLLFLAALSLAATAFGQEDARDAERRFRFLLSRGEELRKQWDEMSPEATPAVEARLHALERRLENGYRHFLNDHPQHARAMVAYGDFLSDQGREEEALGWWQKAIAADPNEAYAYNEMANYYGHYGRAADALKLYDRAIALVPTEPMFRFNWATTCISFRNESHAVYNWSKEAIFERSLEQFRRARDLAPQNFDFATSYAETFYMMPKPDWNEADAAWKYCLGQASDDGQRQLVYIHLSRICIKRERYDEAREWITKIPADSSVRRAIERQIDEKGKAGISTNGPTSTISVPDSAGTKP